MLLRPPIPEIFTQVFSYLYEPLYFSISMLSRFLPIFREFLPVAGLWPQNLDSDSIEFLSRSQAVLCRGSEESAALRKETAP